MHLFSVAGKSTEMFSSRLNLNTLHANTCIILYIWSTFRRMRLHYTALNGISIQRQYLTFLRQFLRYWARHNLRSLWMVTVFVRCSARVAETFASKTGLSVLLQQYFGGRWPLTSTLFPFTVFLKHVFVRPPRQNSSRFFLVMMFCWLFLFASRSISNRFWC